MAYRLTARQRALLQTHALTNADLAYDDIEERGDAAVVVGGWWYLFDRLPRNTFHQRVQWRRQMARSFEDIADDLGGELALNPGSVAEYVAVLLTIDDAHRAHANGECGDCVDELPYEVDGLDWAGLVCWSALHPAVGPVRIRSVIDRLSPDSWFIEWDGCHSRDPNRGYSRG